jgi:cephalosporin hydroxylase
MKLKEIFWNLEKGSTKWSGYFDVYERHLGKFVNKKPRILEIGVLGGGSIEMWLKYFGEDTEVVGVDINEECKNYVYDGKVEIVMGDQGNPQFWDQYLSDKKGFDIVIDDGSHRMDHIKAAFKCLFPLLNNKGVYAIEDLHTAYWPEFQGGYNSKDNFFNLVRELIDDMHNHYSKKKCKHSFIKKKLSGIHIYDSIVFMNKSKFYLPVHSKKN